ncbi:multidrug/biocide efflux PACE transporter [Pseudomonas abietaniphila]
MSASVMSEKKAAKSAVPTKSIKERAFHALLFELIGVVLFAPGLAWLLGQSLGKMGAMTVMISTVAMLWNMVFNAGFDRLRRRIGFAMSLKVRALHAISFETGLIVAVVPLAAWWLSISLWEAFLLDIGLLLLFLPYTLLFNMAYDKLRERIVARSHRNPPTRSRA